MRVSDLDIENIASRLIVTVGNYNINKDDLISYPYVVKGDIVILCDLCIGEKNKDGLYTSCLTVTNELLNKWNINKEMLFSLAVSNGKEIMKPFVEELGLVTDNEFGMNFNYVITNKYHFNGASSVFYDYKLIEQIGENVLLVPASSNEIYASTIPDDNKEDFINNVNDLYQEYREKTGTGLTASVLLYDKSEGSILKDIDGNTFNLDLKSSIENENIFNKNISHSLGK